MTVTRSHSIQLIHLRAASLIKERRWQIRTTNGRLAPRIGVALQQIRKYENGLSRISADRLYQMATALGVSYFCSVEDGPSSIDKAIAEQLRLAIDHAV
jgi:transcriptional regulator with XRE-family HTH domain